MPTAPRLRAARGLPLVIAALLLAGCTSAPTPGSTATSKESASASTSTATPTGGAGALDATPFAIDCDTIAPAATVAAAYASMTRDAEATPPAKSDAGVVAAYGGTVCGWTSSTGTTMTLAVGRFDDSSLTRLKNSLVTSSNAVPTYAGEGYFDLVGRVGTAEAFTGPYWIVVTSDDAVFSEPGGAEPLMDAAIAALK